MKPTKVCLFTSRTVLWSINSNPNVVCYQNCPGGTRTCLLNDGFFSSRHPGGAYFGFADGSVSFLTDTINFVVYQDLATIAGNEPNQWSP